MIAWLHFDTVPYFLNLNCYCRQRSCGKVIFSVVSVLILPGGEGLFLCDHYPWCITPHHTETCPPPQSQLPLCTGTPPDLSLLVTSGGQDWRPVQTCSLEDPHYQCWHLAASCWSTYGGWAAVRILLECFRVSLVFKFLWRLLKCLNYENYIFRELINIIQYPYSSKRRLNTSYSSYLIVYETKSYLGCFYWVKVFIRTRHLYIVIVPFVLVLWRECIWNFTGL